MSRQHNQKRLAQNFLKDRRLVRRLVQLAKIDAGDIVYEIGPGRGIITAELSQVANRVIAIEKDPALIRGLNDRFRAQRNVVIICDDFLNVGIPEARYKVFANIPYNMTSSIVRKILWTNPTPIEAFLIVQLEPARKFAGIGGETLFSALAKPYFKLRILARLKRTDFDPVPRVDSVMLHISKRPNALIPRGDSRAYRAFVSAGFEGWKPNLRTA